jgi:hypothetical protein
VGSGHGQDRFTGCVGNQQMNKANRDFLKIIGIFFLLWAVVLTVTGYWPSLQGFGVSERFFLFITIVAYGMGAVALGFSFFTRSPQS